MCRIARLFLLQRLKGSITGDAHDFNNIETRADINFFPPARKGPKEIYSIPKETSGEYAPLYATVKIWGGGPSLNVVIFPPMMRFVLNDPKQWPPRWVCDQIHQIILEDRRIWAKSIAEHLGISREWVGSIIQEELDMPKFFAIWVPKCLNADQTHNGDSSLSKLGIFFRRDPNDFLSRLVTMDKTCLYHCDPETKQQSMEWLHGGSPRSASKNSECKNPLEISRLDF